MIRYLIAIAFLAAATLVFMGLERSLCAQDLLGNAGSVQDTKDAKSVKLTEASEVRIGSAAPHTVGHDVLGREFQLKDYRGRVVVLMFSANWCGPCKQIYPQMRDLTAKFGLDRLAVLGVMTDDDPVSIHLAGAKDEITWRVWNDGPGGPIATNWGVRKWPTIFVIDHHGRIQSIDPRGEVFERAVMSALESRDADIAAPAVVQGSPIPVGPYFDPEKAGIAEERQIVAVFARHLVFVDGVPSSLEAIQQQMLDEKDDRNVRWVFLFTHGCSEPHRVKKEILAFTYKTIKRPNISVGGPNEQGSRRWDSYTRADDLVPKSKDIRRGVVKLSESGRPIENAQIVIIPRDQSGSIALKEGQLHESWQQQWASSGPDGRFEIAPFDDDYDVVALHQNGIAFFSGVIPTKSAELILNSWVTIDLTGDRIQDLERVMIISQSSEVSRSFFLSGLVPTRRSISLKVPPGQIAISRLVDKGEGVSVVVRLETLEGASGDTKTIRIPESSDAP